MSERSEPIMLMNSFDKGFLLVKNVEAIKKPYRKQEIVRVRRQVEAIRSGGFWSKARLVRNFRYILEEFDEKTGSTSLKIKENC